MEQYWFHQQINAISALKLPARQKYEILQQASGDADEKDNLPEEDGDPPPWRAKEILRSFIISTIVLSSVIAAATVIIIVRSFVYPPHFATEPSVGILKAPSLGLHCGSSVAEAMALNCTFDILTYSWTPELCMDHLTSSEFQRWIMSPDIQFGSFPFFYDGAATQRVPDAITLSPLAGTPNSRVYTPHELHLAHCIFLARRIHRIADGQGGRFTAMDGHLQHTVHCTDLLLQKLGDLTSGDDGILHAVIGLSFNDC